MSLQRTKRIVRVSSNVIEGCEHCDQIIGGDERFVESVSHYLNAHGYKLLHIGAETTTDRDERPSHTTIAILGSNPMRPELVEVVPVESSNPVLQTRRPSSRQLVEETGTVIWFNRTKSYEFIKPEQGDKDVYVHISTLKRCGFADLSEGLRVIARVSHGPKGAQAIGVRLVQPKCGNDGLGENLAK